MSRPPTVTFRYELAANANSYLKLPQTIEDINRFLTREPDILHKDYALAKRLMYKFNSQLRHFKSFKYFKRIYQHLKKVPNSVSDLSEEMTLLKDCCSHEPNLLYLPSRQMFENVLLKILELAFILRKIVLFSMLTFNWCLVSLHRAELGPFHVLLSSLASRVWIIARAFILYLNDWYKDIFIWVPRLQGTGADCLKGFTLPDDVKQWLDSVCPVDDDPKLVGEEIPAEVHGVLARFLDDDEALDSSLATDEARGETERQEIDVIESVGGVMTSLADTDIGVAVAREGRATMKRNRAISDNQDRVRKSGQSEDTADSSIVGKVAKKRKSGKSEDTADSSIVGKVAKKRKSGKSEDTAESSIVGKVAKKRKLGKSEDTADSSIVGKVAKKRKSGKSEESADNSSIGKVAKKRKSEKSEDAADNSIVGKAAKKRKSGKSEDAADSRSFDGKASKKSKTEKNIGMSVADCNSRAAKTIRKSDGTADNKSNTKRRKVEADSPKPLVAKSVSDEMSAKRKKKKNTDSLVRDDHSKKEKGKRSKVVGSLSPPESGGLSSKAVALTRSNNTLPISKAQFNTEMKSLLKKPSQFMRDLMSGSLGLDGKTLNISRKKRTKINADLSAILDKFKSKKSEASRFKGSKKAKMLKEVENSRLNFKKTARVLLWKAVQKS